jgi:hypothetical protein
MAGIDSTGAKIGVFSLSRFGLRRFLVVIYVGMVVLKNKKAALVGAALFGL